MFIFYGIKFTGLYFTGFIDFTGLQMNFKTCYINELELLHKDNSRITGLHFTGFLRIYRIFKLSLLYFMELCFERTVTCLYFTGLSLRDYILQDLSIFRDYK